VFSFFRISQKCDIRLCTTNDNEVGWLCLFNAIHMF